MSNVLQLQILMWVCILVIYENRIPLLSRICAGLVAAICVVQLIAGLLA